MKAIIFITVICLILLIENLFSLSTDSCDIGLKDPKFQELNEIIYIITRSISGMSSQSVALYLFWRSRSKLTPEQMRRKAMIKKR